VTAANKTHERLPEVCGACAVEEKSRREVAVVEELNKFLPDERVQRHVVRLVTHVDDESVNAERVARKVEGDKDRGDDEKGLGDAQLGLMTAGKHTPRPSSCRGRACR